MVQVEFLDFRINQVNTEGLNPNSNLPSKKEYKSLLKLQAGV